MIIDKEFLLEKYRKNTVKICSNDFSFARREIWARLVKKNIIKFLGESSNDEYCSFADNIEKNGISTFPFDYNKKYSIDGIECIFDEDKGMWYTISSEGKRIYLKKEYKSKFRAQRYYKNLLAEQDPDSPHLYCTDSFQPDKDSVIVDIGGAEGIFAAKYLDIAKHIYIFECNPSWIEAMKASFAEYSDKVTIIPKFVSNIDDEKHITIDAFIKEYSLENEDIFFKIDAEGSEPLIVAGGDVFFNSSSKYMLAVCTYHQEWHEEAFRGYFSGCKIEASNGYMLYYYDYAIKEPYLRRGLLRIEKD